MFARWPAALTLLFAGAAALFGEGPYVLTPRDTGPPPEPSTFRMTLDEAYALAYETPTLRFYFRDDRDVLAIEDTRDGYIWKTGLDIPFNRDLDDLVDEGADPHALPPQEERLNTTFTGIANSLISIEYFDPSNNVKRIASAARDDVTSTLTILSEEPFEARLDIEFEKPDLFIRARIAIEGEDLVIRIADDDLAGDDLGRLAYINIAPFFGASGGRQNWWSDEEEDWEIDRQKPAPTGYAVVPDGSGALVRFVDNSTKLSSYVGDVYGEDLSQSGIYRSYDDFSVPHKVAHMPLFGVVHGRNQNAFAGFASSGDEYMEVVAIPEENTTYYTQAYARFSYNRIYYQVYNKKGDGYFRPLEERNHFDVEMHYRFLSGDSADYAGIARVYRSYLEQRSLIADRAPTISGDIPLRLDFLMEDVKDNIIGHAYEVTTRIDDVRRILADLHQAGIGPISTGLIGYAKGGTVFPKPGTLRLYPGLGSRRDFEATFAQVVEQGGDISFVRDYARIAQGQILPWGNAIRGASGWYNERRTFRANAPVNLFYYSRPARAVGWMDREAPRMLDLGATSLTIDGLGDLLFSDYSETPTVTVSDALELYAERIGKLSEETQVNLYRPNQYLWSATDRFLHIPMFSTQYLVETDTVPLLQMVLQGSMDLFGPYSNFSFSSDQDVLRMIDYNVYPSFLVTTESAHYLLMTNSAEFYSTEYDIYRDVILNVYGRVNEILREVLGVQWVDRTVPAPGVVINSYADGTQILINYSSEPYEYRGVRVVAVSAKVFKPANGGQR